MLTSVRLIMLAALPMTLLVSCGEARPPYLEQEPMGTSAGVRPPAVDTCGELPLPELAAACGNEVVPVLTEKPTVYFVLDGSGSMQDEFEDSDVSKLLSAKLAIRDLLIAIGHRIRYGAAVFPDAGAGEACASGAEVFPSTAGDPLACNEQGQGPILRRFLDSIGFRQARGGTSTAATLKELAPTLQLLGPETSIILITDGAPNCNTAASCESDGCIPNLERQRFGDSTCGEDVDCCDVDLFGPEARSNCVDGIESELILRNLVKSGVRTFVIGMPGTQTYASILDRMADAGGTARQDADTKYYSVRDTADLSQSLFAIGEEISQSCQILLQQTPPDRELLNVYLDGEPVEKNDEQGWSYVASGGIELHGEACTMLEGGNVSQVQIVFGCPTIVK